MRVVFVKMLPALYHVPSYTPVVEGWKLKLLQSFGILHISKPIYELGGPDLYVLQLSGETSAGGKPNWIPGVIEQTLYRGS